WQASYSELIFLDKYWPDFDEDTLDEILKEYSKRDRRFGGIS
ncbi:MAG: undecaprenyl diphosphate synthase family protein, partial [Clostridia bacterium]|nr:undecaprenyl diphosphate synthase family protein [Clostridia bacterium]